MRQALTKYALFSEKYVDVKYSENCFREMVSNAINVLFSHPAEALEEYVREKSEARCKPLVEALKQISEFIECYGPGCMSCDTDEPHPISGEAKIAKKALAAFEESPAVSKDKPCDSPKYHWVAGGFGASADPMCECGFPMKSHKSPSGKEGKV